MTLISPSWIINILPQLGTVRYLYISQNEAAF